MRPFWTLIPQEEASMVVKCAAVAALFLLMAGSAWYGLREAHASDEPVWAYPMKPLATAPGFVVYTYCNHGTRLYAFATNLSYRNAAGGLTAVQDGCEEAR